MNYEERYKQALKRAKTILKLTDNPEEANGYVFTIFPELCESEDERIRKEILEYFQQFENEELRGVNISDWISWLEKQGEKPVSAEETELNSLAFLTELGYTCIPPKKEQQPEDWSEEDENNRQLINKSIWNYIGEDGITQGEAGKLIQWLKSLKPHWKPSEEQIKEILQTEYEKGRFDMREEIMKDAVEGVVHHFPHDELAAVHYNDPKGTPMSMYVSSKGLSAGNKVKIIIVKTE